MKIRINSQLICFLRQKYEVSISDLLNLLILNELKNNVNSNKGNEEKKIFEEEKEGAAEKRINDANYDIRSYAQKSLTVIATTLSWGVIAFLFSEGMQFHSRLLLICANIAIFSLSVSLLIEIVAIFTSEKAATFLIEEKYELSQWFYSIVRNLNRVRNIFLLLGVFFASVFIILKLNTI